MDIMKIMGQVKDMQSKLKERMDEAQSKLADVSSIAESGGGMVKAQVNGKRQVIGLSIDPSLLKEDNKQMVQDLIISAVNMALEDVEGKIKEEMQKATEGAMPNIPGFNLGNMGF